MLPCFILTFMNYSYDEKKSYKLKLWTNGFVKRFKDDFQV